MKTQKLGLKILLLLILPIALQLIIASIIVLINGNHLLLSETKLLTAMLALTNGFLILCLWGYTRFKRQSFLELYKFKAISQRQIVLSLGIGFCAMFVSLGISGLFALESLDPDAAASLESLVDGPIFWTLIAVGVIAPIGEELIFRGAILRLLRTQLPASAAIVLQALLFGLYHLNLVQAPPTAVLGIFLGLVVVYSGSLWPAIVIHIVNNTLAITLSQLGAGQDAVAQAAAKPGPIYFILIALVATALVLVQLKKLKATSLPDQ